MPAPVIRQADANGRFPPAARLLRLAGVLATGLAGALVARWLGLPIPFLLGSLAATAALSLTVHARTGQAVWYPQPLRIGFVAAIGTMIGTTFDPALLSVLPGMWLTLLAMLAYIALAECIGYTVYRRVGGYDRVTAAYSALPGGLVEAVVLGERAGGQVATLSLQHFVRIVIVVLTVPTLFFFLTGHAVGSAAGQTLASRTPGWADWAGIALLAPAGVLLGRVLHLPAGHLMGPLILTAALHAGGLLDLSGPPALLAIAQLAVGAGLGVNFARATPRQLLAGFGLGLIAVTGMLSVSVAFAVMLDGLVDMSFQALVVSFAPGGVTEMSLIALSLGVNPVLVAAHHLFRIFATLTVAGWLGRRAR